MGKCYTSRIILGRNLLALQEMEIINRSLIKIAVSQYF